jgi:hypothetical protein
MNDLDSQSKPSIGKGFAQNWAYGTTLFENYAALPVVNDHSWNYEPTTSIPQGAIPNGIPVFVPGIDLTASFNAAARSVVLTWGSAMTPPSVSVRYQVYRCIGTSVSEVGNNISGNSFTDATVPYAQLSSVGYFVYAYAYAGSDSPGPAFTSAAINYVPFVYGGSVSSQRATLGVPLVVTNTVYLNDMPPSPDLALNKSTLSRYGTDSSNAVDADPDTSFDATFPAGSGGSNWLMINLGATYLIKDVQIAFSAFDGSSGIHFSLSAGNSTNAADGTWSAVPTVYGASTPGYCTVDISSYALNKQYLLISLSQLGSTNSVSISSVSVFGA